MSHRAASFIRRNEDNENIIVTDFKDAIKVANEYANINVIIAYSAYNLKLIVDSIGVFNFIPALTADDTHAHSLTNSHDYIFIDGDEFIEKVKGEDFE